MQIQVTVVNRVNDMLDLVALEVTPNGVSDRPLFRLEKHGRDSSMPESIWADRAILLVEGGHDFSDDTGPNDEYFHSNPLEKFLAREHPQVSLKDELRQRIAALESENEALKKQRDEAQQKLAKFRRALSETE